ncbi:MAG: hypothetical protein HYX59_03220 [Elusimicrobia bacterium]|nr:hypothetical protein [Elusimicrobiota bacterium]
MWRRRLTFGGFLIGVALGGWLVNAPPGHEGFLTMLAAYSATPLLVLLSPVLFLLAAVGVTINHAASAVVTWTLLGFLASVAAGKLAPRRKAAR